MTNDLSLRVSEELEDMGASGNIATRELLKDLISEIKKLEVERDHWKDLCDRVMSYGPGSDWQDIRLLYHYALEDYNAQRSS